jgi:hypothetical protein
MPNVKAIIARIQAERARGIERQTVTSHKAKVAPLSRRTPAKPPTRLTTGRRAAAKAAAPTPAETETKTTKTTMPADKPAEGQS